MTQFKHKIHKDSSDEYGTPPSFVRPIAEALGGFDLDPASGAETAPHASTRYTEEDDGLTSEWFGTVWLNPPFSEKERWLRRARAEVADGNVETAVVLLPVDTSTSLFHDLVVDADLIWFKNGRLVFDGGDRNPSFGILLAVYGHVPDELCETLDRKGTVFRPGERFQRTEQATLAASGGESTDAA